MKVILIEKEKKTKLLEMQDARRVKKIAKIEETKGYQSNRDNFRWSAARTLSCTMHKLQPINTSGNKNDDPCCFCAENLSIHES